jgi:hypothetical protein
VIRPPLGSIFSNNAGLITPELGLLDVPGIARSVETKVTNAIEAIVRSPNVALAFVTTLLLIGYVVLRFPGELNPDSIYQYQQAVTGVYDDWHPPIMARLWSVFHSIVDGTWTMFVFHAICYWLSILLCALGLSRAGQPRLAWMLLAVGLFPPFLMLSINVHKDIGLGVVLLLSFAVTFSTRSQGHEPALTIKLIASLLLFYAAMVRINGVFAAVPIACYIWYPGLLEKPVRLLVLTAALTLPTLAVENLINKNIFQARPAGAMRSLQLFDLAGIAHFSGDLTTLDGATSNLDRIDDCYSPLLADTLYHGAKCGFIWDHLAVAPGGAGQDVPNPELSRLWVKMILLHPLAYLEHRLDHFNSEMAFAVPSHHADLSIVRRIVDRTSASAGALHSKSRIMDLARNNIFSTPAFWLVAALVLIIIILPLRKSIHMEWDRAALGLAMSGVIYMAGFAVVGVATDPRYQFSGMLSGFVAAVLAFPTVEQRFRKPRRQDYLCVAGLSVVIILVLGFRFSLPDALGQS